MNIPRVPPKKILAPFDFSKPSLDAWDLGSWLTRAFKASIEALYVYEIPTYPESVPVSALALSAELKRKIEDDMRRELGLSAQINVVEGVATESILAAARQSGADLIVMGTHGRTGVSRALFGSVAESISRDSSVPVLTIRKSWRPIKAVLAPLNFADYALRAFFAAAQFAERLGARLDVLHVIEDARSQAVMQGAFEDLAAALPPYFADKKPRFLEGAGDAAKRIVLVGSDYDLIVLSAHRKRLMKDVVLGATAERVLRHSSAPVLALPDAEEPRFKLSRRRGLAAAGTR